MRLWLLAALLALTPLARAQDPPPPPPDLPPWGEEGDLPPDELPPPAPPPPPLDDGPAAPPRPGGEVTVRASAGGARTGADGGSARVNIDVEECALADVMAQIGRTVRATIAVDPNVAENVTVFLRDIPWREGVDVLARMTRCQVEELPGGGLYLVQPPTVTLRAINADVRELVATISQYAGEPVVLLPDARGRASVDVKELHWREALDLIARAAGLRVTPRGGVTFVSRAALPGRDHAAWRPTDEGPRVDVEAEGVDLDVVLEQVGRHAGRNVLVDPSVGARVTLGLCDAPWQVVVHLAARQTGCQVEERGGGILLLTRAPRHAIRAEGAPAELLLQMIADGGGLNLTVGPDVRGPVFTELVGVPFGDAVRLLAAAEGWELEERGEALIVTAGAGRHEAPLPTTPFEADVAKLAQDVERFARERRLAELDATMAALRDRVAREGGAAKATAPDVVAPPAPPGEDVEAELEDLMHRIEKLAEARQVEELITLFTEVRGVLARGGPVAEAAMRRVMARWEQRMSALGEVRLSLKLQLEVQAGNDALRAMADGLRAEDWAAVRAASARMDDVVERMRAEEREVFHRNAEALYLRGKTLMDRAARLERIDVEFGALVRVTAILLRDDAPVSPSTAIVGGAIVREGDTLVDPATGEEVEGLRVVEITATAVRFRFEDTEFVRELGAR